MRTVDIVKQLQGNLQCKGTDKNEILLRTLQVPFSSSRKMMLTVHDWTQSRGSAWSIPAAEFP